MDTVIKMSQKDFYAKHKIVASLSIATKESPVIAWWSGGLTSAVACHLAIKHFGKDYVRIVTMDTKNEDDDTYRFKSDCEKWYGKGIESINTVKWFSIQEVWEHYLSLNVATGAICSSELKRDLRIEFGRKNNFSYQIFGFDDKELKRANGMLKNYSYIMPLFPLIDSGISKQRCVDLINEAGIEIPRTYKLGFLNNNCFKTGCVQGGIGYWQKMQKDFPDKFNAMAEMEHKLTDKKGEPVTMLKDQAKASKGLVFLKPHPDYPNIKHIGQMKGRPVMPLNDCNGFCNRD